MSTRSTLCRLFQETAALVPDRPALRSVDGAVSLTWREYAERVRRIASGLISLEIGRGSTVALLLTSRPEFHLVDTATLHTGAASVSVYNTLPVADIVYVLRDAGARVLVTEQAFLDRALPAAAEVGIPVVTVDGEAPEGGHTLADLESNLLDPAAFAEVWQAVEHEDLAVLVYTSGTTGPPKGVELTHRAILGNQLCLTTAIGAPDGARVLSFLPMAHVAERHLSHYRPMVAGFSVTCCPDMAAIPKALVQVRPQCFFSPPRLFEKFRAAVLARLDAAGEEGARTRAAIDAGIRAIELSQAKQPVPDDVRAEAEWLRTGAGPSILAGLGLDGVEIALTGAAPVPFELTAFLAALGLPVLEAWGLTECGAFGAFNRPDAPKYGTVGLPLPGVEIALADDGEILLHSTWAMRGYRNLPEATAAVLDADGWLHTGDVGRIDEDGYLIVIDRKKEIMINSAGKNMSPANIESTLKAHLPLVGQACVVGDRRPYNVALLVLDPDAVRAFATRNGIAPGTVAELAGHPVVQDAVEAGVRAANEHLARVEQIKHHHLLPDEWLPGGEELTPTMKLRRRPTERKYGAVIDALYAKAGAPA